MEKIAATGLNHTELKALSTFGWSFGTGMAILSAIGIWRQFPIFIVYITICLSIFHFLGFLFLKKALFPTFRVIGFISHIVGIIVSFLVFSVVYYSFFSIISVILRLSGKDLIKSSSRQPEWITVDPEKNNPRRIEKMF